MMEVGLRWWGFLVTLNCCTGVLLSNRFSLSGELVDRSFNPSSITFKSINNETEYINNMLAMGDDTKKLRGVDNVIEDMNAALESMLEMVTNNVSIDSFRERRQLPLPSITARLTTTIGSWLKVPDFVREFRNTRYKYYDDLRNTSYKYYDELRNSSYNYYDRFNSRFFSARASKGPETDRQLPARSCTSPSGENGLCRFLSDCPDLLVDFANLRRSVCFMNFLVPGVCCPKSMDRSDDTANPLPSSTTRRPIAATPRPRPNPPIVPVRGQDPKKPEPAPSAHPNAKYRCGEALLPQQRIVGGDRSPVGKWPWMAAVFLHGPTKTEFWCGGSLVSSKFILTAAHCTKDPNGKTFSPRQFTVLLGDHNILNSNDDHRMMPRRYRVRTIVGHPDFKSRGFYNDMALLRVDGEVIFNDFTAPICLPPPSLASSNLDHMEGLYPTVLGYGSTDYDGKESSTLQEVKLPVWSNSDCNDAYLQPITEIFLCAGYPQGGKDACQGDSGGPLLLLSSTRQWMQVGIVSFGNKCAEPGYPGVYTRVTHFMPWVHDTMLALQ